MDSTHTLAGSHPHRRVSPNPSDDDEAAQLVSASSRDEAGNIQSDTDTQNPVPASSRTDLTSPVSPRRFALGVLCIASVVVIWVSSSALIKYIYSQASFNRPLFLTWFDTALFSVFLLGFVFKREWRQKCPSAREFLDPGRFTCLGRDSFTLAGLKSSVCCCARNSEYPLDRSNAPETLDPALVARNSLIFAPLWFLANWTFNWGLSNTSVSSGTILSSTTGVCTLMIGVAAGLQRATLANVFGVFITLGGVVAVGLSDDFGSQENKSLSGDFACLLSAFFYSVYTLVLKKLMGDREDLSMFLGFVGIINLFGLMPVLALFHFTGWETFELPPLSVVGFLLLNGFLGTVMSDLLWAWSVLLTTPVVATLGLSLTIPLAMISDLVLSSAHFSVQYVAGALLVLVGFVVATISEMPGTRICPSFDCCSCLHKRTPYTD